MNNLVLPRKSPESFSRSGRFIQGDITALPVRAACIDEVVGRHLPQMTEGDRTLVAVEAFRVLVPGGIVRLNSVSGDGAVWGEPLAAAGFIAGTINGISWKAVKP